MKPSQIIEAIRVSAETKIPLYIEGPPGVGKSDVTYQAASGLGFKERDKDFFDVRAAEKDPVEWSGIPYRTNTDRTLYASPEFIPTDRPVFVFLDEMTAAVKAQQVPLYKLLLDRMLGSARLHPNTVIVGAGNAAGQGAVANQMSTALSSRLSIVSYEADLTDWTNWAITAGIETSLIAFLQFKQELFYKFDGKERTFPCPRTWVFADKILKANPSREIDMEYLSGTVGKGPAGEFVAFMRVWKNLPSIDGIIMSPKTAALPDDPCTVFAICGALAKKTSDRNVPQVLQYVKRMKPEYGMAYMTQAIKHHPEIQQTRAYIEWAATNDSKHR